MTGRRKMFFILSGLLVLATVAFAFNLYKPTVIFSSSNEAGESAARLYELVNPGLDVSVEKIEEVSGLYKVLLKAIDPAGSVTYREAYITKDGKFLTENVVLVEQSISQIRAAQDFVDCLDSKGVRIFGLANQTATVLQFNILGGTYSTKLYVSCDGDFAQQCVDAGVTQVPSVSYAGTVYPGIQTVPWFQNVTQCKL